MHRHTNNVLHQNVRLYVKILKKLIDFMNWENPSKSLLLDFVYFSQIRMPVVTSCDVEPNLDDHCHISNNYSVID